MLSFALARLLTQALLFPAIIFLWDLTTATLRNGVAPQQVSGVSIIQSLMWEKSLEAACETKCTEIHLIQTVFYELNPLAVGLVCICRDVSHAGG